MAVRHSGVTRGIHGETVFSLVTLDLERGGLSTVDMGEDTA